MSDMSNPEPKIVPESTPFFTALIGTCSGTGIFPRLLGQSLWRVIFHLLLLTLLSTAAIVGAEIFRSGPKVSAYGSALDARFGKIILDNERGIVPERLPPADQRSFNIVDGIRFDYFPSSGDYPDPLNDPAQKDFLGIQWDSQMLLLWMKYGEKLYMVLPIVTPAAWEPMRAAGQPFEESLAAVRDRSKKLVFADSVNSSLWADGHKYLYAPFPAVQIFRETADSLVISELLNGWFYGGYITMTLAVGQTVTTLFFLVFVCSLFTFSTWIFASEPVKKYLSFGKILTVTLYAAFPGVVIATLWEMAGLRFLMLDYSQIMIYTLLIYSFAVQFRIQRFLNPPRPQNSRHRDPGED